MLFLLLISDVVVVVVVGADGRLLEGEGGLSGLYSGHHAPRPESASSASPPTGHAHFPGFPAHSSGGGGMLVVPQPINASKVLIYTLIYYFINLLGKE